MYHGILINKQFKNDDYPNSFKVFELKVEGSWHIYGVEIEDTYLEKDLKEIQDNMKENEPWYCHFYNDEILIVVFKDKIFRVKPHISTWKEIFDYGRKLGIPDGQLDFWPNRFQDESHYFV